MSQRIVPRRAAPPFPARSNTDQSAAGPTIDVGIAAQAVQDKGQLAKDAMAEVVAVKRAEAVLADRLPDCGEAMALIANSAAISIARTVADYFERLDAGVPL